MQVPNNSSRKQARSHDNRLRSLSHSVVDRLGEVIDIPRIQASHGYPTVFGLGTIS